VEAPREGKSGERGGKKKQVRDFSARRGRVNLEKVCGRPRQARTGETSVEKQKDKTVDKACLYHRKVYGREELFIKRASKGKKPWKEEGLANPKNQGGGTDGEPRANQGGGCLNKRISRVGRSRLRQRPGLGTWRVRGRAGPAGQRAGPTGQNAC